MSGYRKKHRLVITVELNTPLLREQVVDYALGAILEMQGCHQPRWMAQQPEAVCFQDVKKATCGQVHCE